MRPGAQPQAGTGQNTLLAPKGDTTMTTTQTTHTPGPWTLRDQSEPQGARYTVEVTGHGLRSIVADIRDNWLCEEHGGTAEASVIARETKLEPANLCVRCRYPKWQKWIAAHIRRPGRGVYQLM